ncbi:hypothetical protein R3P38DRAFT_2804511 [Favolaschia claudopus]|uniref:Uncharacterized protein n=1 Tax=Favolaschia claudopus TaxID=2862362 RepID=A0AAV9ZPW2_9AGAR
MTDIEIKLSSSLSGSTGFLYGSYDRQLGRVRRWILQTGVSGHVTANRTFAGASPRKTIIVSSGAIDRGEDFDGCICSGGNCVAEGGREGGREGSSTRSIGDEGRVRQDMHMKKSEGQLDELAALTQTWAGAWRKGVWWILGGKRWGMSGGKEGGASTSAPSCVNAGLASRLPAAAHNDDLHAASALGVIPINT